MPIYKNRLAYYRKKHHYTQEDVIAKLGLSSTSRLSNWEQGKGMPNLASLFKLCELYNTTSERLYPRFHRVIKRRRNVEILPEVPHDEPTTEELLSQLASIIVDAYFYRKNSGISIDKEFN